MNTLRVLSSDPLNKSEPSLDKATLLTGAEWLLITCDDPSTEFVQILTVSSAEQEMIVYPLGDTHKS